MIGRSRGRRLVLVAALGAPLMLAACSQKSDAKLTPVEVDTRAATGGTLRVGILRPATIDPQLLPSGDTAGALVVRTMCDPLIGTDPVTRELSPGVANEWRVLQSNGVQVTVRKGLRFNDGSPFSARDVTATLRRVINPDVAAPQSAVLSPIAGWQEVQESKTDVSNVAVERTSDDTVQIGLIKDDSQFVYALAQPFLTPVSRTAAGRPGFSTHPVCVGPYKVSGDYTGSESTITLVRADGYAGLRPAMSRGGRGWADRVVFTIFRDRAAILTALKLGQLDAAQLAGGQLQAARGVGADVVSVATSRLEYVGLPNKEPLNNPLVAAALSRALDRELINAVAFHGARTPAYNLLPPTLPDSVLPEGPIRNCGIAPHGNPSEARQVLQSNLVGSLGKLPFYFNDEFDNKAMVSEVAKEWATQVQLVLDPEPLPFDKLIARGEASGGFDGVFRMAITADYADQGAFVQRLVSIESLGKTNFTGFNGEQISRLIRNKLAKAVSVEDQRTNSLAVTRATCGVPVIPIAWYQNHVGLGKNVVVAAHNAVDRGLGLPELRELAVG